MTGSLSALVLLDRMAGTLVTLPTAASPNRTSFTLLLGNGFVAPESAIVVVGSDKTLQKAANRETERGRAALFYGSRSS
jgi:hypothetical protein